MVLKMHRRFHYFHRFFLTVAAASLISVFAVACASKEESPTEPVPSVTPAANPSATADPSIHLAEAATRTEWPQGQPVEQSQWVKDRLTAMKQIFGFTEAGEVWIDGYDLRQMVEQPAWFGSFGYNSWAGAGEAVPRSVLHEISHSYWGAFTVAGRADLSWDTSDGTAEALEAFRADLDTFLRQPPDRFEPLRDRFRNLPNLSRGEYPDLFHFGEADLLYMTGGNFQLIPPILRPYFSGYLSEGGVAVDDGRSPDNWDVALSWFDSLDHEDRRIAGEIFGLQHFPTGPYLELPETDLSGLGPVVRTLYEREERQRLVDFAEQFDGIIEREFSLLDAVGADRGFDFWRGYLSDKLALHQRYPDVLRETGTSRGQELSDALDFYAEIAGLSDGEQVERFQEITDQPRVVQLAVLLKPRAIVELFGEGESETGITAVLGSRAERLTRLVEVVEDVERTEAQSGPFAAAAELEAFMRSIPEDELRADVFLLLELLRSSRQGLSSAVLPALDDDALLFLLEIQPAAARSFEISPERLLAAVGITEIASLEQVRDGATVLSANSSGNFAIDAAYDAAVFSHLDRFVDSDPAGVLDALLASDTRLVPWIVRESDGALRAMRSVPSEAADVLAGLTGPRETPWRIIHLVAREDPELAATLTVQFEHRQQPPETVNITYHNVSRAIREFGYDLYWSERNAGPNVEPERFGEFLLALNGQIGSEALIWAVNQVYLDLDAEMRTGLIQDEARFEFFRTFQAALESHSGEDADILDTLFRETISFS